MGEPFIEPFGKGCIMKSYCLDGIYGIEIDLPDECAADLTAGGRDCEPEAREWIQDPRVAAQLDAIGTDAIIRALLETGAWTREELESDPDMTRCRAIWVAAGSPVEDDLE